MNNNTSKNQPQDRGVVSPGFLVLVKGFLTFCVIIAVCYFSFRPKAHHAPTAHAAETNQVQTVQVASAAPEPEFITNTPPQVEVAVSAIGTNKTLSVVVNTNQVKHITFRVKPQFGKDPALSAVNNINTNMTVQNTVQN